MLDAPIPGTATTMVRLSPGEHLRRASVYMSNRAFEEARDTGRR